jgi:hypothetical protein
MMLLAGLVTPARGDTYKLANGESLVGEVLVGSANDQGIQVKVGEAEYKRVPWASFSQDDLKVFVKNPKLEPFVEPFIEVTQAERIAKTAVKIKEPPRLQRPIKQSVFGAMFASGLGLFIVLVLYAGNIYAGYEVAIFRGQQVPLVCGVAAVAPVIGPIIFLSIPTKVQAAEEAWEASSAAAEGAAADGVNPMQAEGAAHPAALKLHTDGTAQTAEAGGVAAGQPGAPAAPAPVVFQRGQYTFNRRFIETKFAGFFGVVRHGAEKDMILQFKTSRGEFVANRITRIAANDLHLEIRKGHATEEVMVPFVEIQEIQMKHQPH